MINEILENIFKKWCEDKKCGKCFVFVKTFNDHMKGTTNLYAPFKDDVCCTHIFWEGLTTQAIKDTSGIFPKPLYCDYKLHFKIAEVSDFQMQKGTEICQDTGIFDKHVAPLMDCLACDFEECLCEAVEGSASFINETSTPYFSGGDTNWAGIDYRVTLRVYND